MKHATSARFLGLPFTRDVQEFEKRVLLYRLVLPLLWLLACWVWCKRRIWHLLFQTEPSTNSFFVDGVSPASRAVKDGAATWKALDVVYNYRAGVRPGFSGVIDDFWVGGIRNAQAVRNRFIIVKQEVLAAVLEHAGPDGTRPVVIASLASGSAQAVLEAVGVATKQGCTNITVHLFDWDRGAFALARRIAAQYGVEGSLHCRPANLKRMMRLLPRVEELKPNIIEMCGFLDYLTDDEAESLLTQLRKKLQRGGTFITCHIHPNAEQWFLREVVNWGRSPWMHYRSRAQLLHLLVAAEFAAESMEATRLFTEPHQIHTVAVCTRI